MHLPHLRRHPHIPFFRIFYSTTFTVLCLVLAVLLLVTPGDHIRESFNKGEIFHIFIVAGLYLLTLLISIFIYAGRLYATRSALARIPKEVNWGEEPGKVGREIRRGLDRSAIIAYESHPRDLRDEKATRGVRKKARLGRTAEGRQSLDTATSFEPAWGVISHPGWSSPCSPDLPNLHYEPVILELSHLIEAKAVSLAPSDPLSTYDPDRNLINDEEAEAPIPDPVAVELLQRPASMGLRDYLSHLATVGMLEQEPLVSNFLSRYEYARYSGQELKEDEFRTLMSVFADILRAMKPLDVSIVDEMRAEMGTRNNNESGDGDDEAGYRQDTESINTTETVQRTPQPDTYSPSTSSASTTSSSSSSPSLSSSSIIGPRSASHPTIHNTTVAAAAPSGTASSSTSVRSAATTNHHHHRPTGTGTTHHYHQPSLNSLRQFRTTETESSGSRAGSVIRLREARGPLDLPYAIVMGEREEEV